MGPIATAHEDREPSVSPSQAAPRAEGSAGLPRSSGAERGRIHSHIRSQIFERRGFEGRGATGPSASTPSFAERDPSTVLPELDLAASHRPYTTLDSP